MKGDITEFRRKTLSALVGGVGGMITTIAFVVAAKLLRTDPLDAIAALYIGQCALYSWQEARHRIAIDKLISPVRRDIT